MIFNKNFIFKTTETGSLRDLFVLFLSEFASGRKTAPQRDKEKSSSTRFSFFISFSSLKRGVLYHSKQNDPRHSSTPTCCRSV